LLQSLENLSKNTSPQSQRILSQVGTSSPTIVPTLLKQLQEPGEPEHVKMAVAVLGNLTTSEDQEII